MDPNNYKHNLLRVAFRIKHQNKEEYKVKYKLLKSAFIAVLLNISNSAIAGIINFNATTSDFTLETLETNDFIITRTADGLANLGFDRDGVTFRGKNGSLLTWVNFDGLTSGFTLETNNTDLFSLESFQSGNGYLDNSNPVESLKLTGLLADGSSISEDFTTVGKINLDNTRWNNLVSVEFIANGINNRAYWDSIRFDRFAAPASVPEPSTILMLMLALFFIAAQRFKREAK